MTQLGVGIIGCGNISTAYLSLAPMFKALNVVAVADMNMDNARAKAAEFNVRADTVAEILAASDVDVIVNLTQTCLFGKAFGADLGRRSDPA